MSKKLEASQRAIERQAIAIARDKARLEYREKQHHEQAIRIGARSELARAKKQARLDTQLKNGRYAWGLAIEIAYVNDRRPAEQLRHLLTKVSPGERQLRRALDGLEAVRAKADLSWHERNQLRFLWGEILENFLRMLDGPLALEQLAASILIGRDLQQALAGIGAWCEMQNAPIPERSREATALKPRRARREAARAG